MRNSYCGITKNNNFVSIVLDCEVSANGLVLPVLLGLEARKSQGLSPHAKDIVWIALHMGVQLCWCLFIGDLEC